MLSRVGWQEQWYGTENAITRRQGSPDRLSRRGKAVLNSGTTRFKVRAAGRILSTATPRSSLQQHHHKEQPGHSHARPVPLIAPPYLPRLPATRRDRRAASVPPASPPPPTGAEPQPLSLPAASCRRFPSADDGLRAPQSPPKAHGRAGQLEGVTALVRRKGKCLQRKEWNTSQRRKSVPPPCQRGAEAPSAGIRGGRALMTRAQASLAEGTVLRSAMHAGGRKKTS